MEKIPMPNTIIMKPLDESSQDEKEHKLIKANSEKIKQVLDGMKYGEDITFEDFLKKIRIKRRKLSLSYQKHIKAQHIIS